MPTNIAGGSKRWRSQDHARFLTIAGGSLAEVEYLLLSIRDLGFLAAEANEALQAEVEEIDRRPSALGVEVETGTG